MLSTRSSNISDCILISSDTIIESLSVKTRALTHFVAKYFFGHFLNNLNLAFTQKLIKPECVECQRLSLSEYSAIEQAVIEKNAFSVVLLARASYTRVNFAVLP